jgi:predicted nucleic acid-binding protein
VTPYLDSSVLVAALVEDEPAHEQCLQLLRRKNLVTWTHALAEVFAALTGGRLGLRVPPAVAAELMDASLTPRLRLIELAAADVTGAIRESEAVGVRGGAIFDFLHLTAARRSSATALYTLNTRHFVALARKGDPKIEQPN